MTPESRKDRLLTQPVGNELVIYDERTNQAHRLNCTAAFVWRQADGERSVSELASGLRESLVAADGTGDPAVRIEDSEELVRLALEELDRSGLLARALPVLGAPMSRRRMMTVTAALLPVVASILAPTPAMAQATVWNGNYVNGSGAPGQSCDFGSSTIDVNVEVNTAGIGFVTVVHRSGTRVLGTFPYIINTATGTADALTLTGTGSGGTVTVNLTRATSGTRSASGNHTNLGPTCVTYNFNNATRPQ